jgi:hypothetical protein
VDKPPRTIGERSNGRAFVRLMAAVAAAIALFLAPGVGVVPAPAAIADSSLEEATGAEESTTTHRFRHLRGRGRATGLTRARIRSRWLPHRVTHALPRLVAVACTPRRGPPLAA